MMNKHTSSVSLIDGHIERMTDNEIKKALECCKMPVGSGACNNCPLKDVRDNLHKEDAKSCTMIMMENVLDLINRLQNEAKKDNRIIELQDKKTAEQKAEIERLERNFRAAKVDANLKKQEIERLNIKNKTLTAIIKIYDWKFAKAKSEAIKEFAKRVETELDERVSENIRNRNPHWNIAKRIVRETAIEMTEVKEN